MEQIIINQNENQNIGINSINPQLITISSIDSQNLNINQNRNQNLSIIQDENQLILVNENGIVIGISDVLVNGISVVSNNIAYVYVPTKTSQLTNDSGFITNETDPTVPSYIKTISLADINNWNNKQNELISGSNIKTINNTSLLGSGNINVEGIQYIAGTGIEINDNEISNTIISYNDLEDLPTIPTKTSDLLNDSDYVSENELSDVAFSGSYADLSNTPVIPDSTSDLTNDSGFITKNVNDLTYYTPTADLGAVALSNNYNDLDNKPTIPTVNDGILTIQRNGTTIDTFTANSSTNKTANITVPTKTSDLTNDSGFINNKYEEYNATETRIGTWLGKPLYRKVINFTTTATSYTMAVVDPSISNADIVMINCHSYIIDTDNSNILYMVNSVRPGSDTALTSGVQNWFRINSDRKIAYVVGSLLRSKPCYLTIDYTKTTD